MHILYIYILNYIILKIKYISNNNLNINIVMIN